MTNNTPEVTAADREAATSAEAIANLKIRNGLNRAIYAAVRSYTMSNMSCEDDHHIGYPLVDLMSNPAPADIGTGEMEMVYLTDEIQSAVDEYLARHTSTTALEAENLRLREDAAVIERRMNILLNENAEALTVTVEQHVRAARDLACRLRTTPSHTDSPEHGWAYIGPDGEWHWSATFDTHESCEGPRPATAFEKRLATSYTDSGKGEDEQCDRCAGYGVGADGRECGHCLGHGDFATTPPSSGDAVREALETIAAGRRGHDPETGLPAWRPLVAEHAQEIAAKALNPTQTEGEGR